MKAARPDGIPLTVQARAGDGVTTLKTVLAAADLTKCDREVLQKLRTLTAEQVAAATKPYVGPLEIAALMARREQIVGIFDRLITEKGESHVLY